MAAGPWRRAHSCSSFLLEVLVNANNSVCPCITGLILWVLKWRSTGTPRAPPLLQQCLRVVQTHSGELQPYVEQTLSVLTSQHPPNTLSESKLISQPVPLAQKSPTAVANPDNLCCYFLLFEESLFPQGRREGYFTSSLHQWLKSPGDFCLAFEREGLLCWQGILPFYCGIGA